MSAPILSRNPRCGRGQVGQRAALARAAWLCCVAAAPAWAAGSAPAAPPDPSTAIDEPLSPEALRARLARPESSIRITLLGLDGSARRFGQFSGLNASGPYAFVDADLSARDDDSGTWRTLRARRLGLPDPEVRAGIERQGHWALSVGLRRLLREEPLQVLTGLAGAGTGTQLVSASAPKQVLPLRQAREVSELNLQARVAEGLQAHLGLRQDQELGARIFGRGTPAAMEFLTEPIDRTTTQLSAGLHYTGPTWQLAGGWNASLFDNRVPVLQSSGGNASAFGSAWVMAMAPGNSAQQWHLSGGVNLPRGVRTSFKLSRTDARQNQAFDPLFVRLAEAPPSLDGRVVTDLAYADLSLQPATALDLFASLRYEDRDDRTPVVRFLAASTPSAAIAGVSGLNKPRSLRLLNGQLEGQWRLWPATRLVAGLQADDTHRNVPEPYRRMAMRASTREDTARLELRSQLSEDLAARLAVLRGRRTGSEYLPDTYSANALSNQLASLMWADRSSRKLRMQADWQPAEGWSLQGQGEWSQDDYGGRPLGPERAERRLVSLEATWSATPDWNASAWVHKASQRGVQDTRTDATATPASGGNTSWQAAVTQDTLAAGLGLKRQFRTTLAAGAEASVSLHKITHAVAMLGGTGTLALPALDAIGQRHSLLRLWAEWESRRDTRLRAEMGADRQRNDDWTWNGWVYNGAPSTAAALRNSDGTTVLSVPRETLVYLRLSVQLSFR